MRCTLGLLTAVLLLSLAAYGQGVTDDDRRGFKDLSPIFIDLDGDRKADRIQPRTYQT